MTKIINQLGTNQFMIELPVSKYVDGYLTRFIVISGDQIEGRQNQTDVEVITSEESTRSSFNEPEGGSPPEEQQSETTATEAGDE